MVRVRSRTYVNIGHDTDIPTVRPSLSWPPRPLWECSSAAGASPFGSRYWSTISRAGSLTGRSRSAMALTTLKIAVFAPMPTASDSTTTAASAGARRICRMP